jgi:hypothetical protein
MVWSRRLVLESYDNASIIGLLNTKAKGKMKVDFLRRPADAMRMAADHRKGLPPQRSSHVSRSHLTVGVVSGRHQWAAVPEEIHD